MIEDINLTGLSEEIIDKIMEELGYDTVLSMACNYKKIKENVNLLKSINITNIDELLINRNELFFKDTNLLKEKIFRFDISSIVKLINDDYEIIDEVLK